MTKDKMIKQVEKAIENLNRTSVEYEGLHDCVLFIAQHKDIVIKTSQAALKMLKGGAWWPIETCPDELKDGRQILTLHTSYGKNFCMCNLFCLVEKEWDFNASTITHWRPLDDGECLLKLMEEL